MKGGGETGDGTGSLVDALEGAGEDGAGVVGGRVGGRVGELVEVEPFVEVAELEGGWLTVGEGYGGVGDGRGKGGGEDGGSLQGYSSKLLSVKQFIIGVV